MSQTRGRNTLFLGDLSTHSNEENINALFSTFGEIVETKIMRSEETKRNLSYGFITFSNFFDAKKAMNAMDGYLFFGRRIRIGWASYRSKREPRLPQHHDRIETASIHVSYISYQIHNLVTEESLRILFSTFGVVVDCSLKKSAIDRAINKQCGYGFVHYSCSPKGIASALAAVAELNDKYRDEIAFKCSISHSLEKMFLKESITNDSSSRSHFEDVLPSNEGAVSLVDNCDTMNTIRENVESSDKISICESITSSQAIFSFGNRGLPFLELSTSNCLHSLPNEPGNIDTTNYEGRYDNADIRRPLERYSSQSRDNISAKSLKYENSSFWPLSYSFPYDVASKELATKSQTRTSNEIQMPKLELQTDHESNLLNRMKSIAFSANSMSNFTGATGLHENSLRTMQETTENQRVAKPMQESHATKLDKNDSVSNSKSPLQMGHFCNPSPATQVIGTKPTSSTETLYDTSEFLKQLTSFVWES